MFRALGKWWRNEEAAIAIEVGILMPVMLLMCMGTIDVGTGVLINQKVVNSAQTVGDLLGRDITIATSDINDCVAAGKLAVMPYDTTTYGVDIAGIQFVGGPTKPKVIWRDTINMTANPDILTGANGLGNDQDGVLGVTVQFNYTPMFSGIFTGAQTIYEVSYVRGRKGLFIPRV